jgi:hypothetical protein
MEKRNDVQVCQRYAKVHSMRQPPPIWEVNSIYPDDVGVAYVGLMNLANPRDKKTLSVSALLDKTRYRLVVDLGAAA